MRSNSIVIPLPREQGPDWLLALRNGFPALLVSLGLKTRAVKGHVHAVGRLCAEVGRRGLTAPDSVDEATFGQIRDPLPARLSDCSRQRWTCALDRFIAFLVKEGAMAAAPQSAPVPTALETLCADYGTWLRTPLRVGTRHRQDASRQTPQLPEFPIWQCSAGRPECHHPCRHCCASGSHGRHGPWRCTIEG